MRMIMKYNNATAAVHATADNLESAALALETAAAHMRAALGGKLSLKPGESFSVDTLNRLTPAADAVVGINCHGDKLTSVATGADNINAEVERELAEIMGSIEAAKPSNVVQFPNPAAFVAALMAEHDIDPAYAIVLPRAGRSGLRNLRRTFVVARNRSGAPVVFRVNLGSLKGTGRTVHVARANALGPNFRKVLFPRIWGEAATYAAKLCPGFKLHSGNILDHEVKLRRHRRAA